MSHHYLHSARTAGAAARDRQLALEHGFAQLLNESPAQLVTYAARLCAHAAERTERGDLSHLAIRLNEVSRDIQGQPAGGPPALPAKEGN